MKLKDILVEGYDPRKDYEDVYFNADYDFDPETTRDVEPKDWTAFDLIHSGLSNKKLMSLITNHGLDISTDETEQSLRGAVWDLYREGRISDRQLRMMQSASSNKHYGDLINSKRLQ